MFPIRCYTCNLVIAQKHPEDVISVRIRRGTGDLTVQVTLGERQAQAGLASRSTVNPGESKQYGLTVRNLTPSLRESFGLAEEIEGVIVVDVSRGSASDAGFMPNDIIFKVRQGGYDQDIRTVDDFKDALERLEKGRNAAFSIRRQNMRTFLTMKIPA